jgi:hypothetical protein
MKIADKLEQQQYLGTEEPVVGSMFSRTDSYVHLEEDALQTTMSLT